MANLWIKNDTAVYVGQLKQNRDHAHLAVQLSFASEGDLSVSFDGAPKSVRGVLIGSLVRHRIVSSGADVIVLLFEPGLRFSRVLNNSPVSFLDPGVISELVYRFKQDPSTVFAFLDLTFERPDQSDIDPRVKRVVEHVSSEENCRHDLGQLAEIAGVSKSRLTHLFKDQLGFSLKHYCLWKRTLFAIDSMRSSNDLTAIAASCGFSDLSHLSRTFRAMFGMTMREVFQRDRSVQVTFLE